MDASFPLWAKFVGVGLLLNELRGIAVFAGGIGDLHANGLHLGQLWLLPLILVPPVIVWACKRRAVAKRVNRRLGLST